MLAGMSSCSRKIERKPEFMRAGINPEDQKPGIRIINNAPA
jgi:hypothetical protein